MLIPFIPFIKNPHLHAHPTPPTSLAVSTDVHVSMETVQVTNKHNSKYNETECERVFIQMNSTRHSFPPKKR